MFLNIDFCIFAILVSKLTDITEMKKKDSLMATYRKLLNKVKASKGTGSGAKDVIKPDWFAYNAWDLRCKKNNFNRGKFN